MTQFFARVRSPFCDVIIVGDADGTIQMLHLDTGEGDRRFAIDPTWQRDDARFSEAVRQINAYFAGDLIQFDLPLAPQGTDFQRTVWAALQTIPCGETRTHKQVATQIGNPAAARAVGMANNKNPIPLLIPCHRVIGASGKLVGYAHGLAMKTALLELENTNGRS